MYPFFKRLMDVLFAIILLIILSPLFIPIIIALRLSGEGEVFYQQKRVGYKNQIFGIWKFATMLKNSPNIGTGSITLRNDPRVTLVGKYLRITKINELPQIINILLGDMSFVGPRPLMKVSFDQYTPAVQQQVYNTRPGITGVGSIVFRDEEKLISESKLTPQEVYTNYIFPYKGNLELWYQKNKGFTTDFLALLLTAWILLYPKSQLIYKLFKDLPLPISPEYIDEHLAAIINKPLTDQNISKSPSF
jgi:lipopolysaccharide/colanic/teichoic acid biosynthesis glycosyltransferase